MSKVRNLDDAREKCEWCGESAHPKPLMCPRIVKVQYEEDIITVYFQSTPIIFEFNGSKLET